MIQRMPSSERQSLLKQIMHELHEKATTQADFTADAIAKKGEVSVVLVYRLVGTEFKELRSQLPGPRRSPNDINRILRRENKELRKQVCELNAQKKTAESQDIADAINIIESQDEEIRLLKGRIALLEQRLEESETIILPARQKLSKAHLNKVGMTKVS